MLRRRRFWVFAFLIAMLALVVFIGICNAIINKTSRHRTYVSRTTIPHNRVGILLGTAKYLADGRPNWYYINRIVAAADLMKSGGVDYLIISGDNSTKEYNEPEMMRKDLYSKGVDTTRVFLDYAGFRTFDSMIRLREIFGVRQATVISQHFHNERAIFLGSRLGMDIIGYDARDVSGSANLRMTVREKLARVKVFIDGWFNTKPRYLGPTVNIPS